VTALQTRDEATASRSGIASRSRAAHDARMKDGFRRLSGAITNAVGSPIALLVAVGVIVAWAVTGPLFGFSDTWQLAINTGTTVVTFLMVFVIQASQNRDGKAIQLKLDELIRANRGARNEFIDVENASESMVELEEAHFKAILKAAQASNPDVLDDIKVRSHRHDRGSDTPA
jgi:low affinity Fe/Cu permease